MSRQTQKLSLTLFDGSDLVNYNDFNNNFNIIENKLGNEYVEVLGWTDFWWYRKWSSGRCECGVDNKLVGNTQMTNWVTGIPSSGLFHSAEFSFGDYPVKFERRPFVATSINYTGTNANIATFTIQRGQAGGQTSPPFLFVSTTSGQINNVQASMFVTGWWKNCPLGPG